FWQIMPATAREQGLVVNDSVDQRFDLELATRAACRILKAAYAKYGDWSTAAASYNGGMGRISRELAAQQALTAYDLYLTEETSRYMFRLLAMKAVMDNPSAFGYSLRPDQFYYPIDYDVVEVKAPIPDWSAWARNNGTTYMQLREHNQWIRGKSLPAPKPARAAKGAKAVPAPATYRVLIPKKDALSRSKQEPRLFNPNWSK
ncbi:MAG: lytic transglycosylase domain-containing protein, partial [Pseudoflavonifractor sp.]|nr:lytic transglycosylase domain-containing protein [Pseudoflavonifractor sp.]